MINIKNFDSNLIKIDKKSYKNTDIYQIRYITIKKLMIIMIYNDICSVNPLYLTVNTAHRHIEEKMERNT